MQRYTNHYYGEWRRLPLLAHVNTRLPKTIHRCEGHGEIAYPTNGG